MLSIEGVANLYNINHYLNKAKLRSDIDYDRLEDYHILNDPIQIELIDYNSFYNKALEIINSFNTENTCNTPQLNIEPEQPLPEIVKTETEKPKPSEPKINENILANTFDFTPKKKVHKEPIITQTDYEKQKINKIIYGSKVDEDDTERLTMIESIESLRDELQRMDIKINTIPTVDETSTMYDIKNVYKMLLHKKNINVHYETAKDFILVGIDQLINFCDGRTTSWGKRPNLTGWNSTAKLRLNGLKTELSTLASDFFNTYNIGPLGQILLSLVPSAILHASMNSQQSSIQTNNENALQNLHNLL